MKKFLLGKKTFKKKDQEYFLKLSKDYNQAHLIVKKNKDQFNTRKPIVHGMHVLLYILEFYLKNYKKDILNIDCNFLRPIFLNQKIFFFLYIDKSVDKKNFFYIEAVDINKKMFIKILFSKIKNRYKKKIKKKFPKINKFKIKLQNKLRYNAFPQILNKYSAFFCEALAKISFFIGMKFPGQNGIFYSINFNLDKLNFNKKFLYFAIDNSDKNLKNLNIFVDGFLKLNIKCLKK